MDNKFIIRFYAINYREAPTITVSTAALMHASTIQGPPLDATSNAVSIPIVAPVAVMSAEPPTGIEQRWTASSLNATYEDIMAHQLPKASQAQEWSTDEHWVLEYINNYEMSKVLNEGTAKTLNLSLMFRRYCYLAQARKYEDGNRVLFERSREQIKNRIDVLKRNKKWKS